jgi:hypothetical protein
MQTTLDPRRIGALVKDLRRASFCQRWHEFDQFRREMFSRQHPPLGLVILPGAAHISPVHGRNEAGEDHSMGKSSVSGPECADDCDKCLASAFLNLTRSFKSGMRAPLSNG